MPVEQRASLTRERVLEVALELIDEVGVEGFSMRRLGSRLGVDPMTIYWHVRGRDAVLEGVLALVLSQTRVPAGRKPWHEQLRAAVRAYRDVIHRHPNILRIALTTTSTDPEVWTEGERMLRILSDAGLSDREAGRWYRLLAAYVNGFLATEGLLHPNFSPPDASVQLASERPHIARVMTAKDLDADFEAGLDVLISELRKKARKR